MSKKVLVAIADGTEELEAVTAIDCLRRAQIDVTVASVAQKQITTSRKVRITADKFIADCVNVSYDLIALPGGMPGAEFLRDCKDLIELLKKQTAAGRYYAAICASPAVVLQHHGLLKAKRATCHPSMKDKINNWLDEKVVVDGNCITSQGPGTALAFSLKLVELLCGKQKASEIAKAMLA
jgi:4-methyl-5(b-hydroxyethyl)-thiazole monophosphate biosynthesis